VNELPIVVQDFDGSTASNSFIDAFRASITLQVVSWPVDKTAEEALASNAARAVLIIPSHFGRDMARGVNAPVQFLVDASDANTAKLVSAMPARLRPRTTSRQAERKQDRYRPPFGSGSTPGSLRRSSTAREYSCLASPCSRLCWPRSPWRKRVS
jgi:ABC-2 type transport system permease protein